MNLRGRSFLTLLDYSPEEIRYLLDLSHRLKREKRERVFPERLKHRNIVLIFDKSSTRTRCAFEVAALDEGAHVTYLSNSQMGKKESLEDTAKVLGRYYDAIEYRGFGQHIVEDLARYSGVPVWNGLTDTDHPTQILADFMTIEEHARKPLDQIHLCYVGDARNNMGNSLMIGCAKMGMKFTAIAPTRALAGRGPDRADAGARQDHGRCDRVLRIPRRGGWRGRGVYRTSGCPWVRRRSLRRGSSCWSRIA